MNAPSTNNNDINKILTDFARDQRGKIMAYLIGHYCLPEYDSNEIFQRSFITLWKNYEDGKYQNIESDKDTIRYFFTICRNKALERLRELKKVQVEDSLDVDDVKQRTILEGKVNSILDLEEEKNKNERNEIVQRIVLDLPNPCNKILWGFYWENCSVKYLAKQYGISENNVKVQKFRCCEKFGKRIREEFRKADILWK